MHKRLWLLAGAAVAMLLVAVSATATTTKVSKGTSASLSPAPFAQAWANVPQTTAGRKAKSVLVFGEVAAARREVQRGGRVLDRRDLLFPVPGPPCRLMPWR